MVIRPKQTGATAKATRTPMTPAVLAFRGATIFPAAARPDGGTVSDLLADIVKRKKLEVAAAKARVAFETVRASAEHQPAPRDFVGSLRSVRTGAAVIAEVKRKSPSAGWIRPEWSQDSFAPEVIAGRYEACGAAAISCLTDFEGFGGELGYIGRIRAAVRIPVMRKDFLIDPYQVFEARAAGADAVLLIAECLDESAMRELHATARAMKMGVILESHDEANFDRTVAIAGSDPGTLIGVNNRDLRTMKVDLGHTLRLAARTKDVSRIVGESGIGVPADLDRLREAGVRIVLVGERLMRQADPGVALAALLAVNQAEAKRA
jgi:indole-3-glycerol phosphate synthase